MLTLKKYQARVLDTLEHYLDTAVQLDDADMAFYGITRRAYRRVPGLEGLPYVCLRLPTGGGKTLVAAHSVSVAAHHYLRRDYPLVLWLVPTNTIREQTLAALRDPRHPYREALDSAFDGRVTAMDVRDALFVSRSTLEAGACIVISTLAALRQKDTEGFKVYESNGHLMDHFAGLPPNVEALLDRTEAGITFSLANLLRLHRPLVIVDEAHNARTELSFETLTRFAPSAIIEFTATPAPDSNVLDHASAAELHAESMIKLPIHLEGYSTWQQALSRAIAQREQLAKLAVELQEQTGEYLRPIVLIQAQPHAQHHETLNVEFLARALQDDFGVPRAEIAVATGDQREIAGINLFDPGCPFRYILTVQALAEGWDCSFAYILCSVAQITTPRAVEQILGRILRLPKATRKDTPALNEAYAFVISADFAATARSLSDALVENGFLRYEADRAIYQVTPTELPLFRSVGPDSAPADRGELFRVPMLALRVGGQLRFFEQSFYPTLSREWDLARCDPALSEEEFRPITSAGQALDIDISDKGDLTQKFIGILHAQYSMLDRVSGWNANDLVLWLDHRITHGDVTQRQSTLFLARLLNHLTRQRGFTVDQLVHDRFRLRDAADRKINDHRQNARNRAFQACFLPDATSPLEVTEDCTFTFTTDNYAPHSYYEGGYQFQKHYFKAVGDLKSDGEEFDCAVFLDQLTQVDYWVRNLERKGLWFQISTGRFYPDFVARLVDGRYLIVEYKGAHLFDSEDSRQKRMVGSLWERISNSKGLFIMPTRGDYEAIRRKVATEVAPTEE